ncbi:unnamed protein product [Closterium sp. Naga37s-1]|nr:unnamed protein product [Closterium sp. Naga37s-1]
MTITTRTPTTTLHFPASPSAAAFSSPFPSAFSSADGTSASPSASPSPPRSSSAWPHAFLMSPPAVAARYSAIDGEPFLTVPRGSFVEGGAADVALDDWINEVAAASTAQTAPTPLVNQVNSFEAFHAYDT